MSHLKANELQPGDATVALNAAKAFFALAGTFFKSLPSDPKERSSYLLSRIGKLIAATTNLAFSVELYLKGLAMLTLGAAKHGHNLVNLFDDLPKDIQESIDSCYRYRISHDADQNFLEIELGASPYDREPTEEEKKACRLNSVAKEDVRSLLEAEKDAFNIWRYFYEKPRPSGPVCIIVHFRRLGALVNAIQDQFSPPEKRPNYPD